MKELIQFLNEYQDERKSKFKFSSYDINGSAFIIEKNPRMVLGEETIISKKFWFIEWLVEKDKIDYWKIGEIVNGYKWSLREKAFVVNDCVYESMLMLLSIQDDPIEFLISILK